MTNLKGSKTEANLQTAFAGESQEGTSILIMQAKLKKKVMYKFPIFFLKLLVMRKSMLNFGSRLCMAMQFLIPLQI